MSKRAQLIAASGALVLVVVLLTVLLVAIMSRAPDEELAEAPVVWAPEEGPAADADPWAGMDDAAVDRVWSRPAVELEGQRRTLRQIVETDILHSAFPNLRWQRIGRTGWRAFRLDGSVYEVQFVLTDGVVEFGPSWVVQLDPTGPQPEGSGGVVAANIFAQVLQDPVTEELGRHLNRENDVVEALTNHAFGGGARLASALLVYLKSQRPDAVIRVDGWTVVPERVDPGSLTLYRAFFQWYEDGQPMLAQWEVNVDTHAFRGLNLLATDIMAIGDTIDTGQLENIRPEMLDTARPNDAQRNAFTALRMIAGNERLVEAVTSLLGYEAEQGVDIDYRIAREDGQQRLTWGASPVEGERGTYRVSYDYLEDLDRQSLVWHVRPEEETITPDSPITRLAHMALTYGATPETE